MVFNRYMEFKEIFNGVSPNRHRRHFRDSAECGEYCRVTNQKVRNRLAVERRLVRQFMKDAIAAGLV